MLLGHRTGKPAIIARHRPHRRRRLRVHGYGGGGAACDRRASGVEHGFFGWGELDRRVDRAVAPHRRVRLPVVWMVRDLVCEAAARSSRPNIIVRLWFAFGLPAFGAILTIFWLMIAKPQLW